MSITRAFLTILIVTFLISGSGALGLFYYQHIREKQKQDPAYHIVAIVQSTSDPEMLKTSYLAELLNLSVDYPVNLHMFNTSKAAQLLLQSPVISSAQVHKIFPGTLHIDYTTRRPVVIVADYTNMAMDSEGVLFPIKPFFTPKKLPEVYGGLDSIDSEDARKTRIKLIFFLIDLINTHYLDDNYYLASLDVSDVSVLSSGQRQIVVIFEKRETIMVENKPVSNNRTHLLRLSPDNYRMQLANYLQLRPYLEQHRKKDTIIDLRLSDLAFIGRED